MGGLNCDVALRKESVDRNNVIRPAIDVFLASLSARRAWIEIPIVPVELTTLVKSLSARRAWIEMTTYLETSSIDDVALRKESVDRNTSIDNITQGVFKSLSARRAWIEIQTAAIDK